MKIRIEKEEIKSIILDHLLGREAFCGLNIDKDDIRFIISGDDNYRPVLDCIEINIE